jgi:hypothetical protein
VSRTRSATRFVAHRRNAHAASLTQGRLLGQQRRQASPRCARCTGTRRRSRSSRCAVHPAPAGSAAGTRLSSGHRNSGREPGKAGRLHDRSRSTAVHDFIRCCASAGQRKPIAIAKIASTAWTTPNCTKIDQ